VRAVLLLILSLCGFAAALAARLVDPLVTAIASDLAAPVGRVALLASAFALPFGLMQPLLGPLGDAFGKPSVIRIAIALLALCLLAGAFATDLDLLFVTRVLAGMAGAGILPVSFALIGDSFPLAVRQIAMSRFLASTLVGQLVGASAAGILAHLIGWRGVLGAAAGTAIIAAVAANLWLPKPKGETPPPFRLEDALARYRLVLANPRSFVCFGMVFLEGMAIYGVTPFIGTLLEQRGAGGVREAGFVVGGLGLGGLLYSLVVPLILKVITRHTMMALGGVIAAFALASLSLDLAWPVLTLNAVILGFGFFLLHNSIQTEVTELAPSARASTFSLHALSFYFGQFLGPILYGLALPAFGARPSLVVGGLVLMGVGFFGNVRLSRPLPKPVNAGE
jgi:predicted MFS family arabinose efflux permease